MLGTRFHKVRTPAHNSTGSYEWDCFLTSHFPGVIKRQINHRFTERHKISAENLRSEIRVEIIRGNITDGSAVVLTMDEHETNSHEKETITVFPNGKYIGSWTL